MTLKAIRKQKGIENEERGVGALRVGMEGRQKRRSWEGKEGDGGQRRGAVTGRTEGNECMATMIRTLVVSREDSARASSVCECMCVNGYVRTLRVPLCAEKGEWAERVHLV